MSAPEPISLVCFEIPGDSLMVRSGVVKRREIQHPGVVLNLTNFGEQSAHTLDTNVARAVFNWLGAWLVTEGAGHG